ncbi:MAG: TonB family protein, partial [Actinomycetota bacterium]
DAQNTYSTIEFLWKGSSKEIHKSKLGNSGVIGYKTSEKNPNDNDSENLGVSDQYTTGANTTTAKNPVNNGAVLLVKPEYPRAARAVRVSGAVNVQVTINELGYVISAKAISGHPLLQSAAVEAAKKSKFRMTILGDLPVKVVGVIVYNFVP